MPRGQALPLVAVCLVVLFGFAALAVDVGAEQYRQRAQQTATDAAAIAGASELEYSSLNSDITTAAQADATTNGFTNGNGTTVTVNYPPATGYYASATYAVQVVIATTQRTFFGGIIGQNSDTVSTTASAILTSGGTAPCVYQLDPNGTFTENNGTVLAPTCGIISNGQATYDNGTISVASIGYAGTLTVNGTTFTQASPAPSIPATDPCAQIPGCATLTDNPPATTPCTYTNLQLNTSTTLQQGVYCGGLTLNSVTVTFSPGVYVFTGNVRFNTSTVTGTNVVFVFDSGTITINNGTVTLSGPTSGAYNEILMYQPKANTSSPTLNSGSNGWLMGALYFPGAQITGNTSGDNWNLIIAASIQINNANLKGSNGAGMAGGVQNAVLGE